MRLALLLLALGCSPPKEQEGDYNFLVNILPELEHPTPENARLLQYACDDYLRRAQKYRQIHAWRIDDKVDRYVAGCAKMPRP